MSAQASSDATAAMGAGPREAERRRVLVLGGSSEIAGAIVAALAGREALAVSLVGRDPVRLASAQATLEGAGVVEIGAVQLDARDTTAHEQAVERAFAQLGGVDLAIVALGVLGEPGALPADLDGAVAAMQLNYVAAGSLLLRVARRMRAAGAGTIVVLSSVAAERPRRANAVYGSAKAGLDALARGLGDELHDTGVKVLVVRPGFVHTRMTSGMAPAPFATDPAAVAAEVLAGLDGRSQTIWTPAPLRWLMLVMRALPRPIFRRIPR
jgi:decaprenylphospho-beta-D-erythro-pentofuranosid-2-ulose 2-reductase